MAVAIGIVNTRIRDFKVSNTRPVVGETVEFTGYLEWHLWPVSSWYGADSRVVKVLVDGTEVGSGMTTAQGFFRVYWRPTSPGSYIAKAKFEGTIDQNPCESPPIAITVLTEEQKKEEQQRLYITIAAIAGVCATGLIGFGLYMDYQRRREEMMTLLAARR
jgi:hypothetical protein